MNNWAYNLDMLAQNGVLDFDAPAFITGQNPRYVGSPSNPPSPYVGPPLPNAPALNQPQVDEFKPQNNDNNAIKNPSWKKWAFGAIAIGALVLGAFKFKSITKWFKDIPKKFSNKFSWKNTKQFFKDKIKAVNDFFKKGWTKIKGWFRR